MNKPKPGEYSAYMSAYINLFIDNDDILSAIAKQKDISHQLFHNLSEEKAMHAYAEDKWTIKQVLGHMIDAERTFAYRILAFSRGQEELPGFDENTYVELANFDNQSIQDLADEFKATRESNLYLLNALTPAQLDKVGIANGNKISVTALIYILAGHELHHINIVKERYLIS